MRNRIAVAALTVSLAGLGVWKGSEGYSDHAIIPVTDDKPTIGYGSTRWESGAPVRMGETITRERAEKLARNLMAKDEALFAASLPGVRLHQAEYDAYLNFVGQYGFGNWRQSSMRKHLLAGEYPKACDALLRYRYVAGYDCSTVINGKPNRRCWGVWSRQLERHAQCWSVQ